MTEKQQEFVGEQPKRARKKTTKKKKSLLEAEIIGKYCTFYGTVDSSIQTMDGVPMEILVDPDGRHLVKMFSTDGARAFLYLDQVASFTTQPTAPNQEQTSKGFQFDMSEPPTVQDWHQPQQPGQTVDEVYYRTAQGRGVPRRTERVNE
jgi:hypothetical protein